MGDTARWVMDSLTYTAEALRKVCALLKVTNLRRDKFPSSHGKYNQLDSSLLLGEEQHCLYQHLFGMAEWMVKIGRFDILFTVTSLNHFSADPWEGHIKKVVKIFDYFRNIAEGRTSIVIPP